MGIMTVRIGLFLTVISLLVNRVEDYAPGGVNLLVPTTL